LIYEKGANMTVRIKGTGLAVMDRNDTDNNSGAITASGSFVSVTGKGVVSSKVRNYASYPFCVRKAAEVKAEIDRVGLPKKKK
jgi:hypothetical protein